MSRLDKVKIAAEVAKLVAECWGIYRDKSKETAERERRIKELEAEIARLKEQGK